MTKEIGCDVMIKVKRLEGMPCYAIYSAGLAIQRTYKPLLDELGITYPQYLLLNVLWEEDHLTVGDIGKRLGIESSTLTPLLKRLQAAGFVERTRNPADERQVFVELTQRSKAIKERASCLGPAVFGDAGIAVERIYRIRDEVEALRDALNAKLAAKRG
ncbi:MAG: MarR family transcriptional regulator [Opitutaceae bacterium]|jgi:DNA-binding MarR family transcriptional regulator